jgi:hypothetical protein
MYRDAILDRRRRSGSWAGEAKAARGEEVTCIQAALTPADLTPPAAAGGDTRTGSTSC